MQYHLQSDDIGLELVHPLGRVSYQIGLKPRLLTSFPDYAFKSLSGSCNLINFLVLAWKTRVIILCSQRSVKKLN